MMAAVSDSYQHGLVTLFNISFIVFSEKLLKKNFGGALEGCFNAKSAKINVV